ncbi:MAG: NUDIX domain-containing protein, partial [Bryobacteraceae bacterium]
MHKSSVVSLVAGFATGEDRAARKSQELILQLLAHSTRPFSRDQFSPGHITATGLVLHPSRDAVLLVHHRRLDRWLLPGGHVEDADTAIYNTARREVIEETGVCLAPPGEP